MREAQPRTGGGIAASNPPSSPTKPGSSRGSEDSRPAAVRRQSSASRGEKGLFPTPPVKSSSLKIINLKKKKKSEGRKGAKKKKSGGFFIPPKFCSVKEGATWKRTHLPPRLGGWGWRGCLLGSRKDVFYCRDINDMILAGGGGPDTSPHVPPKCRFLCHPEMSGELQVWV